MLYTLVILACFGANGTDCRTYEQPATEISANPSTAFVQAQGLVAQWKDKHPGTTKVTFRLEPGRGA